MAAAQLCVRPKGSDICPFHPGQKVILECEDCPGTLVCSLCTTSHHKRHGFRDIQLAVREKVDQLNIFIQKSKQETLPEFVREKKWTIRIFQANNQGYQNEIMKVKLHGEKMKMEVDLNTATKVSRLEFLLKENNDMLGKHQAEVEKLQIQLEKEIKEIQETLKTGTDTSVYDTAAHVSDTLSYKVPSMPAVVTSKFSPCKDIKSHIHKAFGNIQEIGSTQIMKTPQIKPGLIVAPLRIKRFLDQPETLHEHKTSYGIWNNCFCPTANNMAWTCGDDSKLHLVDNKGLEHKTLQVDVEFDNICLGSTSHKLYCSCTKDHSVRRINTETGETTLMFNTDNKPYGIARIDNDWMVVSTENDAHVRRVCVYTMKGKILNSYIYKEDWTPFISACNVYNNIALLGGSNGVTVLNALLQEMYTYRGQGLDQIKRTKHANFICYTAVFVDKYLLLGDFINNMIHVLKSSSGECLHLIKSDSMSFMVALGVQQDGVLWVGCWEPERLLCIKYCE